VTCCAGATFADSMVCYVRGTPGFMAPEVCAGARVLLHTGDGPEGGGAGGSSDAGGVRGGASGAAGAWVQRAVRCAPARPALDAF
jgi:hypothetical protein